MSNLRKTRVLTTGAMLAGIAIVLGFFKFPLGQILEIRFSFLAIAVSGALFGPLVASIVGVISDLGGFMVRPTGDFSLGFTLSAAITGLIFGLVLYRQRATWQRILLAQIAYSLIVGMVLNTLWLSILIGKGFPLLFTARLGKELLMIPINTLLLLMVMKALPYIRIRDRKAGE